VRKILCLFLSLNLRKMLPWRTLLQISLIEGCKD
jgi:hypothetical protein